MSLKKIVANIRKEAKEKDEVRERILSDTKVITRLSDQSILSIHRGDREEAEKRLDEARKGLEKLSEVLEKNPQFQYMGYVVTAYQEYAEAKVLQCLVEEDRFPTPEEIGVPPIDYALGLADLIGELRRRAIDHLRKSNMKVVEKSLLIMDDVYTELMTVECADAIAPGMRRKLDVDRKLIETTRGDMTLEIRRGQLEKAMGRLEKTLKKVRLKDEEA